MNKNIGALFAEACLPAAVVMPLEWNVNYPAETPSLSGGFGSRGSTNAGEVIEFDLPKDGILHYYRAVIEYSN